MIVRLLRAEEEITAEEWEFVTLEIEDRHIMRALLEALNGIESEYRELVVRLGGKSVDFNGETLVVYNPIAFDINEKTTLNALYKSIERDISANTEAFVGFENALISMAEHIENLIDNYSYDIVLDREKTVKDLLKLFSVRISDEGSAADRLMQFFRANAGLKLWRLIVFVNAKAFFRESEMMNIAAEISATHTPVIFLESKASDKKLPHEKKVLIDSDSFVMLK